MTINYSIYIQQLQKEGYQDVHLETGADGEPMIICISRNTFFRGLRVRYRPEFDLFEPIPEPKKARKRRG